MELIYLDANSTTPLDPRVFEAMKPYFLEKFGNPSAKTHSFGWDADLGVETARKNLASLVSAIPKEIFFTSGATESNNIALRGVADYHKGEKIHIISTLTEHKSTIETLKFLSQNGVEITFLKPDKYGRISKENLESAIKPHTKLLSVIWANNEIGTLNPIAEIGSICEASNILFHVDACQGLGYLPIDVQKNKIHLLSMSSHKMYGPKGIGALFIRQTPQRVKLSPILFGAGHEKGIRPGTLNVPAIVGFGEAALIAKKEMKQYSVFIQDLRDQMLLDFLKLPFVELNGHPVQRLPNNLNLTFKEIPNTELLKKLPQLALSTGSACSAGSVEPSHVLSAIGLSEESAGWSLRIGLHKFISARETAEATEKIKSAALQLHERRLY